MPNDFYHATGNPADGARALSAPMRAEFDLIEAGIGKFPAIAGHAGQGVTVNGAADALESVTNATYHTRTGCQDSSKKDAADGYAGLTALKINILNALGTVTSFLTNSNTAARTYTFPDKSGVVQLDVNVSPYGRRNVIINGDFDIWQRATSVTDGNGYTADDRWWNGRSNTGTVVERVAFALGQTDVPDNPKYYSRTTVTSVAGAANYAMKQQDIEGVRTLAGQQAILTFYAKADDNRNIAVELSQSFGSGFAPSAQVTGIGAQIVSLSTSWQKISIVFDVPSILGKDIDNSSLDVDGSDYLGLTFWFDAGTNHDVRTASLGQQSGVFDISHIQLEKGSSSTDFERLDEATKLKMCQRYYQVCKLVYSGKVSSGSTYRAASRLPVRPRQVAWQYTVSQSDTNFGTITSIAEGVFYVKIQGVANGSGTGLINRTFSVVSEIESEDISL